MSFQNLTEEETLRRKCGCLHTSDMLKEVLSCFPSPPPPTPTVDDLVVPADTKYACISAYCAQKNKPHLVRESAADEPLKETKNVDDNSETPYSIWTLVVELFRMLQVSVVATALVAYYLVYVYVQLIYMVFRSVVYFHNVDGPMKITIGVITATSLLVVFNLFLKIERLFC